MFFYFSPLYFGKKSTKPSILSKIKINKDTFKKTIPIFQKLSYIIAFFFFYISLYWISYSINIELFSIFTLILNILIIILFFIFYNKDKPIINLIHRSNFLVFSFIWLINFISTLVNVINLEFIQYPLLDSIFIINSLLSLIWLISIIILDKYIEIHKKNAFYLYFLTYFSTLLIFYIKYYFDINYILFLIYIWFVLSIIYFELIIKIKYFTIFDAVSKYYWIFINYIINLFVFILLFIYPEFFWYFIFILFCWISFHYYIHNKYKNYFSLFIVLLSIILIYIKLFIPIQPDEFIKYITFIYILPFIFITYTYFIKTKYEYDNYFINFSWILFSIVSIIVYFSISKDFYILHISIIFLLQSFLLFSSFAKLRAKEPIQRIKNKKY